MKLYFRVLVTLYALAAMAVGIFLIAMVFNNYLLEYANNFMKRVFESNGETVIFFIIALVFVFVNLGFLLSGFLTNKKNREISNVTEAGEIIISLNTIETISINVSRKFSGVREVKTNAKLNGEFVNISIKMIVLSDINVPALSAEIQNKVKKTIEETVGIKVGTVKIIVDNVQTAYKGRVE